ncbi:MAG: AAA family ATPase [Planctomycetaceae bacterium]|nr:AAA family ATPase [Planctomycetaceae bacterium]
MLQERLLKERLEFLLEGLNPEQREAVGTTEGPVLVLAGAGSGKTRVVTVRAAYLLSRGVKPENLLCVTFTNKAAREMQERIEDIVGKESAGLITVGTFHAFCLALLRQHSKRMGFGERFALLDESDQQAGLRQVLRELRVPETTIKPRDLAGRIGLLKNRLISPEAFLKTAGDDKDELVGRAYEGYQKWLRRGRALDFDDLLIEALRLLEEHDDVRTEQRRRFRYLQVDEYQDTNAPQYELVRQLSGPKGNLCAVGDDDQSIYGWRGADVRKILGFQKDFPGAAVIRLETNYRSTPEVLAAANKVIANNPNRHAKTLRAHLPGGEPVTAFAAEDDVAEADHIAKEIQTLVGARHLQFKDVAVLFRTATQPRVFESQFRARGVPYTLVGGMSFFDRKEVRDMLAYLRLALEPKDEAAFLRVVDRPPRGIGKASVDRALEYATAEGLPVADVLLERAEAARVPDAAARSARALFQTVAEWAEKPAGRDLPRRIEELIERVGYRSEVERAYSDETERTKRWRAVEDLVEMAERHAKRRKNPSVAKFVDEMTLDGSNDNNQDGQRPDRVTLMTLHAAKGLEFPRVYLVGLEEGILPHARSAAEEREGGNAIEEERRLCYVGITRAMEKLVLSWCQTRARGGGRAESHISRFVYEIKGEKPPKGWLAAGVSAPPTKAAKAAIARATRRKR